jgi:hypothetical protein
MSVYYVVHLCEMGSSFPGSIYPLNLESDVRSSSSGPCQIFLILMVNNLHNSISKTKVL